MSRLSGVPKNLFLTSDGRANPGLFAPGGLE